MTLWSIGGIFVDDVSNNHWCVSSYWCSLECGLACG